VNDPHHRSLDLRHLSDDEVGGLLRQAFAFPASPDLAPGVLVRLQPTASDRRWRWSWPRLSRGAVLALLALVVAGAIAAAAILGVPGIRILTVEELERPAPAVSAPAADPDRASVALGLGTAMSLDDVRARVEMPVVLPADPALGPPDAFYLDRTVAGGMVSMVWSARPELLAADETGVGLLISQFDGSVNPDGFAKLRDEEVQIEPVSVGGSRGWWLHGATHLFLRRPGPDEQGHPVVPTRLAGDTLLWERDGLTYRLEGSTGRERAVEIAASIGGNGPGANGVVPS
jgi:hypothetical protein